MRSQFSLAALKSAAQAGILPIAIVIPGDKTARIAPEPSPLSSLPLAATDVTQFGAQMSIPTWQVGGLSTAEVSKWLGEFQPDLIVVACFPRLIPPLLLQIPTHGFINIHPSLLPAFRGPYPLFWQFRAGLTDIGVTAHQMDAGFDSGDIIGQAPVCLPLGCSGEEADRLCGMAGGKLAAAKLPALLAGDIIPAPQPNAGSYQHAPTPMDFRLTVHWSARRAFHFLRGTAEWERPYQIQIENNLIQLRQALGWEDGVPPNASPQKEGGHWRIPLADGILLAR